MTETVFYYDNMTYGLSEDETHVEFVQSVAPFTAVQLVRVGRPQFIFDPPYNQLRVAQGEKTVVIHRADDIDTLRDSINDLFLDAGGEGGGSGLTSIVYVNTVADLPDPIGDEITLADGKKYCFGIGVFNLGANRIVCGQKVGICGQGRLLTTIQSSASGGVFLTATETDGVMQISGVQLDVPDAQVFEFGNATGVTLDGVGVDTDSGLGVIYDIENVKAKGCVFQNFTDGFRISGTNGTVKFEDCTIANTTEPEFAIACVRTLTDTVIDGILHFHRCVITFVGGNFGIFVDNSTGFTLGEAAYKITECHFTPSASRAIAGVGINSDYLVVQDCFGVTNSKIGQFYVFTESAETEIVEATTPVKAAGTTTPNQLNKGFNHPIDNQAEYKGNSPVMIQITATATILVDGTADLVSLYLGINDIPTMKMPLPMGSNGATGTLQAVVKVKPDDIFELFIANETNDDNLTVIAGTVKIIEI